jgi:hypothetical protein
MADKIRILVESMMVDMLYFVKKGVFTKQEAKQIIKDRENHGNFINFRICSFQKISETFRIPKNYTIRVRFRKTS